MTRKFTVARGEDFGVAYDFPTGTAFTGYTAVMNVYSDLGGTTLLSFGTTASANGSAIQYLDNIVGVTIKVEDIDVLPVSSDPTGVNVLYFDIFLTSPEGSVSKLDGGAFILQPVGSSSKSNISTINVALEGEKYTIVVGIQPGAVTSAANAYASEVAAAASQAAAAASATDSANSATAASTSASNAAASETNAANSATAASTSASNAASAVDTALASTKTVSGAWDFITAPTAPTQWASDNSTKIATTAYADAKVENSITSGHTTVAPSGDAVYSEFSTITLNVAAGTDLGAVLTTWNSIITDGTTINLYASGALNLSTTPVITKTVTITTNAVINVIGANYVSITGTKIRWDGGRFQGTRTAGQKAIQCTGTMCVITNVSGELLDKGVHQAAGSGYMNVYDKCRFRNNVTCHMHFEDGVGPRATNNFGDTDGAWYGGSYNEPTNGAIWLQTEGAFLRGNDFIHSGGLQINTNSYRHIEWLISTNNYWDSTSSAAGIEISNDSGTYHIRGLWFVQDWSCTGQRGVYIHGSGVIDGVFISDQPITNNIQEAYRFESGTNIIVENPSCYGNNASAPSGFPTKTGNYPSVYVSTSGRVRFRGGAVQGDGVLWTNPPTYQFYIDAGVTDFWADGVTMDTNHINGQVYIDPSVSTTQAVFTECQGYNAGAYRSVTKNPLIYAGGVAGGNLWVEDNAYGRIDARGTNPTWNLYNSGGASDQKYSRLTSISFDALDDSYANPASLWSGDRGTGATWERFRVLPHYLHQEPLTYSELVALATSPSAGDRAFISDGSGLTYGDLAAGGGSAQQPVYYDGANWRYG